MNVIGRGQTIEKMDGLYEGRNVQEKKEVNKRNERKIRRLINIDSYNGKKTRKL